MEGNAAAGACLVEPSGADAGSATDAVPVLRSPRQGTEHAIRPAPFIMPNTPKRYSHADGVRIVGVTPSLTPSRHCLAASTPAACCRAST